MSILHVSTFELTRLWGELVEAYHGVNNYGGTVAELYAYRLMPYSPTVHVSSSLAYQRADTYLQAAQEVQRHAAGALRELCELFAEEWECAVMIEGKPPLVWARENGPYFGRRAHVEVLRNEDEV